MATLSGYKNPTRLLLALCAYAASTRPVSAQPSGTIDQLSLERLLDLDTRVGSYFRRTLRQIPATAHVVTEQMIRERGYNYLYDALRDVPGIDVTWMAGLYGPILMQHGLDAPENNKLLIMVDGVVDNNLSAGTAQVYLQYSLHNIKQIEIVWGPASSLYGANAMTGVINLISKTGAEHNGIQAEIGGMSWDPEGRRPGGMANIAGGLSLGDFDLSGSFHYVRTRGPDFRLSDSPRSDDPDRPADALYYFSPDHIGSADWGTYMAQLRAKYEPLALTASAFIWEHRGGEGTYGHEGAAYLNGFLNKPDMWNFRNMAFSLNQVQKLSTRISNDFTALFRTTVLLDDGYDPEFTPQGTGPNGRGMGIVRFYRPDREWKLDDKVALDITPFMHVLVGAAASFQRVGDYQKTNDAVFENQRLIDPGTVPTLDESKRYNFRTLSGYAEHHWDILDNLSLTTGLRLDAFTMTGDKAPAFFGTADHDAMGACLPTAPACKTAAEAAAAGAQEANRNYYVFGPYTRNYLTVNPRAGLVSSVLDDDLTLKALYGEGFRSPTPRELFSISGSRISNEFLLPEKIRTAELGSSYRIGGFGVVEADLFFSYALNLVQLSATDIKRAGRTSNLNRFQNVGAARIYGFDLKANIAPIRPVEVFATYSFQIPEYVRIDPGNRSHVPSTDDPMDSSSHIPRQATHKANLGVSVFLLDRRLVFTPRVNWVGARRGIITGPLQQVDAHTSLNLSVVASDLIVKGTTLQLVGYNLTNNDILSPGFRTARKSDWFPAAHPEPGLHVFAKLGYRLSL